MADTQTNTAALERTKELTDRLEAGIQDLLQSDKYMEYLKSMSQFHRYSTRNTLLIHMQNPNATRVASYKLWDEQFNRHVKKGEKSIRIFAPISPPPEKKLMEKLDPATGAPVLDSDGKPVMEEMTALSRPRFKLVPVFDVSQTYGDPLPELVENLTGDVEQYSAFLDTLRDVSPLPVEFEPLPENNDGYCRYGEKIGIREGMSEVQTVSAVVHEITHARLHDKANMVELPENAEEKSKRMREVEAESVSYVVCQHFGIETSPNSFGYLAEWGSEDMSEFKASLDVIRKESNALITAIDERFKAICKERGIDLSAKEPEQTTPEAPTAKPPAEPSFTTETHTENIAGVDFTATDIIPEQPAQETTSSRYTELQQKGFEIAQKYEKLPLQDRIGIIAETFGCKTGSISTSPCRGKWRGTSDISLKLDNGVSLFIGNYPTPRAKTAKVHSECINSALAQYNPEIVSEAKVRATTALILREAEDNAIAAEKGLKPYTFLNVELNDGSADKSGGHLGWYYVTLAVDDKIFAFVETGLKYDIAQGVVGEKSNKRGYFVAGALKDSEVDFVFNNVAFSSESSLYHLDLSDSARERAEMKLMERQATVERDAPRRFVDDDKKIITYIEVLKRTFEGNTDPSKNDDVLTSKYSPSKKYLLRYRFKGSDFDINEVYETKTLAEFAKGEILKFNINDRKNVEEQTADELSHQIPEAADDIHLEQPEEAFEITYWQMGTGTLALHYFNEGHERYGDFEELASIAPDRSVTFRQADLSDEVKEKINVYALTAEIPNMAADIPNEPKKQDNLSAEDYHLGFGPNENGVEVWNWNETEAKDGSPKFLATIDNNRDVTYLDDNLPDNIKADIENIAHGNWKEMFATEMAGMDYDPPPFTASESPEILPDPSITAAERNSYGYTFDDMLPLRKETALALFAADHTIYMLYDDNTEATAFDSDEIMTFAEMNNGVFGIIKGDWENSPEYAELAAQSRESVEQPNHIYGGMDSFDIYQLKNGDELHYHRFASLNQLKADSLTVDKDNYNLVYSAPLLPTDTPDEIYRQFNHAHPHDYTGRSISVSDVIVIQRDSEITAHYVDNDGFVELPVFLGQEQQAEVTALPEQAKPMAGPVIQTKLSEMLGLHLEDSKAPPPTEESSAVPKSVYRESIPYAREHDELDKYRDDVRLNTECRDAIHTAINESRYDTHFYKMKDAAKQVIDTYGAERVELIMAKIVQGADWDGRYSRQNKEWAKGFEIPQSMKDIYSNTHPILLDGFLDRVREKPSVLETLKANAEKSRQQSEPKQDNKKSKEMEM